MIGYQASHEQFTPAELLQYAALAEKAGFKAINSSDHFLPWSERQGQSGYSFAWLGAAMAQTSVPYGVVCTPGYRNHPAIVAQAAATLSQMFPERFWMALGSGEAMNEKITGEKWPPKPLRNERLYECYHIIKQLLAGETVNHYGHVVVEDAKLYTLPEKAPLLVGAAVTKETAEWMAPWVDGLITVHQEPKELKALVDTFRKAGGEGKPIYLKVQLAYSKTEEEAKKGAFDQWRTNIFHSTVLGDMRTVEQFDALGEMVTMEKVESMVRISSNIQQHIDWIKRDLDLGFEKIILHQVTREQELFIQEFGDKVLPKIN